MEMLTHRATDDECKVATSNRTWNTALGAYLGVSIFTIK